MTLWVCQNSIVVEVTYTSGNEPACKKDEDDKQMLPFGDIEKPKIFLFRSKIVRLGVYLMLDNRFSLLWDLAETMNVK